MQVRKDIIQKCKAFDPKAQKEMYDTLLPYLNSVCRRYLYNSSNRSDALQESFIKIFTKIDQFDINKGSFKSWSTKITINSCLQYGQKASSRNEIELSVAEYQIPISPEIIARLSNEEVLFVLSKMPTDYLQVFNLYIIDGFSHTEIAEMLNIKSSLSRKRLARARDWISHKTELKTMIG
ncbi:MAG: sigma-70 family RNA polymerase sigma factor [Saprospiraceae bacterium]|nr:sigma-70 family RNA polymerase sigma factor [Saprospiraceae bacterium]